jgi:LacI family transcriptional regulator
MPRLVNALEAESPKHRQVSHALRVAIVAGRYAPGARLPSEPQLVRQFGVSRPTVARALLDLHNEGLIERRAGSGTYVRGAPPANPPFACSAC